MDGMSVAAIPRAPPPPPPRSPVAWDPRRSAPCLSSQNRPIGRLTATTGGGMGRRPTRRCVCLQARPICASAERPAGARGPPSVPPPTSRPRFMRAMTRSPQPCTPIWRAVAGPVRTGNSATPFKDRRNGCRSASILCDAQATCYMYAQAQVHGTECMRRVGACYYVLVLVVLKRGRRSGSRWASPDLEVRARLVYLARYATLRPNSKRWHARLSCLWLC